MSDGGWVRYEIKTSISKATAKADSDAIACIEAMIEAYCRHTGCGPYEAVALLVGEAFQLMSRTTTAPVTVHKEMFLDICGDCADYLLSRKDDGDMLQ